MGGFAFVILMAGFAVCLVWYMQNFEARSDGDRGFLLALKPEGEEEKPKLSEEERLLRGAGAVKQRAQELGISPKNIKKPEQQGPKDRIRARFNDSDEPSDENGSED
jgi:hypothetical protein